MQFGEFDPRAGAQRGIEIGQRLVEKKRLGLLDDGAPDRDALALSAGQLRRPALEQRLHLQHARGLGYALR